MSQLKHDHIHAAGADHAGHAHGAAAQGRSCCAGQHGSGGEAAGAAIDPVCGMKVDPAAAKNRFRLSGAGVFLLLGALPHAVRG